MIVAIDGFAASGKGSLAKRLAAKLGYHFLDTGVLYRIVAYLTVLSGETLDNHEAATLIAKKLTPAQAMTYAESPVIRTEDVSQGSSVAGQIQPVRDALVNFQRNFANQPPGAVLDGRDIGNFICPDADVKLFITADLDTRAKRRFDEQISKGDTVTFEEIKEEMVLRDKRDSVRTYPVEDSVILDTTSLSLDEVFKKALEIALSKKKAS